MIYDHKSISQCKDAGKIKERVFPSGKDLFNLFLFVCFMKPLDSTMWANKKLGNLLDDG